MKSKNDRGSRRGVTTRYVSRAWEDPESALFLDERLSQRGLDSKGEKNGRGWFSSMGLKGRAVLSLLGFAFFLACLFVLNLQSDEPLIDFDATPIKDNEWDFEDATQNMDHPNTHSMSHGNHSSSGSGDQGTFPYKRGYGLCVGENPTMIVSALYTIDMLRTQWLSALPIVINHCNELSSASIHKIESFHNHAVQTMKATLNQRNSTITSPPDLMIKDICVDAPKSKRKRLTGWFCKSAALIYSPVQEYMVMDTDTIWFKNPEKLWESEGYKSSGALYFRDRILPSLDNSRCNAYFNDKELVTDLLTDFIAVNTQRWKKREKLNFGGTALYEVQRDILSHNIERAPHVAIVGDKEAGKLECPVHKYMLPRDKYHVSHNFTSEQIQRYFKNNGHGYNYFWHNKGQLTMPHVQESSVLVLDIHRKRHTIEAIKQMVPFFQVGYGDKEIYWIASTIVDDSYALEPYLVGSYGDCGEILHFDPFDKDVGTVQPYFMNGQYVSENLEREGQNLEGQMSRPTLASADTSLQPIFGGKDATTGSVCGACEAAGGCIPVPEHMTVAIKRQQRFQVQHGALNDPKWYKAIKRVYKKVFSLFYPVWLYKYNFAVL